MGIPNGETTRGTLPSGVDTRRRNMGKKLFIMLLFLAMVGGVALSSSSLVVEAQLATRSLPETRVAPGAQFTVRVHAEDFGDAGQVEETVQSGFTYVMSSLLPSQVEVDGQVVTFTLLDGEHNDFTYMVQAPATPGVYPSAITGILRDFDLNELPVTGNTQVTVIWDPWSYDVNQDGTIDLDETIAAVRDYFGLRITQVQAIEVISLYFGEEGEGTPKLVMVSASCDEFRGLTHVRKKVGIAVGDSVRVALCSNPSTGFAWSASAQIGDPNLLIQTSHEFVSPEPEDDGPPLPGAPGEEVWTFEALNEGWTVLSMEYGQPWEGGQKAAWTFHLAVVVR
jgi:predicted secreted protein